jgi:hypothetical protein
MEFTMLQNLKIESGGMGGDTHVYLDGMRLPHCQKIVVVIEANKPVKVAIDLIAGIDFEGKTEVETKVVDQEPLCAVCQKPLNRGTPLADANCGLIHPECREPLCTVCHQPLDRGKLHVGTGDGAAHWECLLPTQPENPLSP